MSEQPLHEMAAEIAAAVPEEDWAKVPTDLSRNLDHYLYGSPRTVRTRYVYAGRGEPAPFELDDEH